MDAVILCADGHLPIYNRLPCKLLLAAFELKFTTAFFFFFLHFHCSLRAHSFHSGEKDVRVMDTLPSA